MVKGGGGKETLTTSFLGFLLLLLLSLTASSKFVSISPSPSRFFDAVHRRKKRRVTFIFLRHDSGEPLDP
jgi:hypothetical protein